MRILAALEHEGAQSHFIRMLTGLQDVFPGKAVAGQGSVAPPDSAVKAVVAADVAPFDECPQIDLLAETVCCHLVGRRVKALVEEHVFAIQQAEEFVIFERLPLQQFFYE